MKLFAVWVTLLTLRQMKQVNTDCISIIIITVLLTWAECTAPWARQVWPDPWTQTWGSPRTQCGSVPGLGCGVDVLLLSTDATADKCLEMSQYEMQGCHVDLEQAGSPDSEEISGIHSSYCGKNSTNVSVVSDVTFTPLHPYTFLCKVCGGIQTHIPPPNIDTGYNSCAS